MPIKRLALLLAVGLATPAWAADDTAALREELRRLAERIESLERQNRELEKALVTDRISEREPEVATRIKYVESQVDSLKGPTRKLTEALDGVKVGGSLTAIVQHAGKQDTASNRVESRTGYRGDITVSLPVGSMGSSEGTFFTHMRLGQGEGVGLRPTYTSTPNTLVFQKGEGADDSFAILAQAWYQLKIPLNDVARKEDAREHLYVTVGKIDPFVFFDQNAVADDESTKFVNNVFVHNPLLDSGGDTGADAYGFQPGVILRYANSRQKGGEWGLSIGAFSSDTGANFSGSNRASFVIGQAELNTRLSYLPGMVRLYAWRNSRARDYDGVLQHHAGWGISANQKVLDSLTLFGRYGHRTEGKAMFDRALTLGFEQEGTPWRRSADSLGLAIGTLRTGQAFHDDTLASVDYAASGHEKLAELYYRYKLNGAVDLTPHFQWIVRPGGDGGAGTIRVVGLRARLGF